MVAKAMMSISAQPTTLIAINLKEEMTPSLESQPRSILAFQDLRMQHWRECFISSLGLKRQDHMHPAEVLF